MNKFDDLYNALIMEIDWKSLAQGAVRLPGQAISGTGRAIGALGYGFGTGGRTIPGTAAIASGIQKAGGAIASAAAAGTGKAIETMATSRNEKIAKQLGISSKAAPKSNETTTIALGKFAGKGLGLTVPKALLQKPVSYEGGLLYTIPLRRMAAAGKEINSIKVLHSPERRGAADVFYFDKNNMPIQNAEELGLPKTAILKPNPDKQASDWILTDRQTSEPEEMNVNTRQIIDKSIDINKVFKYKDTGGKMIQYKALTVPDTSGNFIAIKV